MSAPHIPVMAAEVVAALAPRAGETFVDGTFGAGGYSQALLDSADCQVWGIDRDPDALAAAAPMARHYRGRLQLVAGRFGEMDRLLAERGVDGVDGVALDLGVSSMQLDRAERGFSFRQDGPLDMRMERAGPDAADLVNETEEGELARIIADYGEERHARRIARAIVRRRAQRRFARTGELAATVRAALPGGGKGEPIDPATRTFQALRIAVNDEMGELERGLAAAERALKPRGRLAVVSFHSLEDRKVKNFLRARSGDAPAASRHRPVGGQPQPPSFDVPQRRPHYPGAAEIDANPRARSARLRTAIRTAAPAWTAAAEPGAAR